MDGNVLGVVVAGGMGQRMGKDKTALRLPGLTKDFITHAADLLASAGLEVRINCAHNQKVRANRAGYPLLPDIRPRGGVLLAIWSILKQAMRPCLVIPCDMPFLNLDAINELLDKREQREGDILLTAWRQGHTRLLEPLAAIYEYECLPLLDKAIAAGAYKISVAIPPARILALDYFDSSARQFFNINEQKDFDEAVNMIATR